MSIANPIQEACDVCGGQSALARRLGVTAPTVAQWLKRDRPVPPERCVEIEAATGVRRWALRPDDWHRIWPELTLDPAAPKIPKAARAKVA